MNDFLSSIRERYKKAKNTCAQNYGAIESSTAILNLALLSLRFLVSKCRTVQLVSRVPNKQYIGFVQKNNPTIISRPANKNIFLADVVKVEKYWKSWLKQKIKPHDFARMS
jgi:hypothetical protein